MTALPLKGLQVDQDQLEHLFRVTPVVSIMATVGAVVASYPYLEHSADVPVFAWISAFVLVSLARIAGTVIFLRQRPAACAAKSWYYWAAASTLTHAGLWGACSLTLVAAGDPLDESILHVVLAAVAMGATVHLSAFFPLLVTYIALVLGPLIFRDLWIGGTYHLVLAFLSAMIGLYALLNSRNQSQALAEILRQRRRNAELIERLQQENAAANQAREAAEQADRSKARLFAAANHDLRQPLHAVTLLAQTLQRETEAEALHATAARIGECVNNLSELVDAMLELSQLDAGAITPRPEHFALRDLLDNVAQTYEPLARAKGLAFSIPQTQDVVHGDPRLLARVISNLVANAIRYTERGGVQLSIDPLQGQAVLRLHVKDSGIGIAQPELPRIFEEFYQVANRARDRRLGLGLGLATVRRLADRMALDLQVQSQPGVGSDFSFVVSRGDAALVASAPAELPEGPLRDRRVLVVEDDVDSRVALSGLLRQWTCQVRATAHAQEALAWVDAGYRPELVIADYRLDGQRNGTQTLQALRDRLGASLPALLITGEAFETVLGKPEDVALLRKPVRPMPLRSVLNKIFAGRS